MIDRQLLIFDVSSSSSILDVCFSFRGSLEEHALGNCCGRQALSQPLLSWLQPQSGMVTKYQNVEQEIFACQNSTLVFIADTFLSCKEFATNMAVLLPVNKKSGKFRLWFILLSPVVECRRNQETVKNVGKSSELPLIITSTRFKRLRPRPGT